MTDHSFILLLKPLVFVKLKLLFYTWGPKWSLDIIVSFNNKYNFLSCRNCQSLKNISRQDNTYSMFSRDEKIVSIDHSCVTWCWGYHMNMEKGFFSLGGPKTLILQSSEEQNGAWWPERKWYKFIFSTRTKGLMVGRWKTIEYIKCSEWMCEWGK